MLTAPASTGRSFRLLLPLLAATLLVTALPVFGQQDYVTRFDAFAGFTYLDSPHVSLREPGFHFQAGVRANMWLSLGFDYSRSTGDLNLTPDLLLTSLQQQLGGTIAALIAAGKIPPTYQLVVPAHSVTQTFAGGPQFSYRGFKSVTLFIRPSAGGIHEVATPHPGDAIATGIVAQLAPEGKKTDWVKFYGFGAGVDFNATKHLGLRIQFDLVRDHLFSDLLKDARNTVRVSIGPCFNFGNNIARR